MNEWWNDSKGFFGENYFVADNSVSGYENDHKSLEERTYEEVEGIIGLIDSNKPVIHLLDAPCGYGRHSLELAKKGINITGIDINSFFHVMARNRLSDTVFNNWTLKKQDIRKMEFNSFFDVAINMFFSFGFLDHDTENINFMKKIYNALKDEGQLILHTHVFKERHINSNINLHEKRDLLNGAVLELTRKFDPISNREEGKWVIHKNNNEKIEMPNYSMRIYSQNEYYDLLTKIGFKKIMFYGGFNKIPFTSKSKLLVITATK